MIEGQLKLRQQTAMLGMSARNDARTVPHIGDTAPSKPTSSKALGALRTCDAARRHAQRCNLRLGHPELMARLFVRKHVLGGCATCKRITFRPLRKNTPGHCCGAFRLIIRNV